MTATPEQLDAGARWAARYRRYAPRTDQDRLDDFERSEQRDENERWRNR